LIPNSKEEDEERLEFLSETLQIISNYFNGNPGDSAEQLKNGVSLDIYCKLVCILLKELKNVLAIFSDILACKKKMNENFDIIELSLRRYQKNTDH
jgi:hypothetical protein